jgi:hypothetical protein
MSRNNDLHSNLPSPLNVPDTSSPDTFIRLIPLPRQLQLVYLERRETMLVNLEADAKCAGGARVFRTVG